MRRTVLGGICLAFFGLSSFLQAEVMKLSDLKDGWNEVPMGGDTSCSRGTPFSFFIHPGKTNKVVIDYMGGGACWNSETCAPGQSKTFLESIEEFKTTQSIDKLEGVYDLKNPQNPLADWYHVVVPYCTGDIHWGENDQSYTQANGKEFTIRHRGATNSKAVLNWIQTEFASPEKVFVTGCSAGAYGSIYWYPHIREMFPHALIRHMSDSGISPITESFAKLAFKEWNIEKNRPLWMPAFDPKHMDWTKLQVDYLYRKVGEYYPEAKLAAFTSAFDSGQRFFYFMMDGNTDDWGALTKDSLTRLANSTPQFNYFVTPGTDHCVIPYNYIYTKKSENGQPFIDWFKTYIEGGSVANAPCVNCQDTGT